MVCGVHACAVGRYQEKFYFNPGDTGFQTFKTRFATIGVAVCWDQWFPEAARCMALKGAEVALPFRLDEMHALVLHALSAARSSVDTWCRRSALAEWLETDGFIRSCTDPVLPDSNRQRAAGPQPELVSALDARHVRPRRRKPGQLGHPSSWRPAPVMLRPAAIRRVCVSLRCRCPWWPPTGSAPRRHPRAASPSTAAASLQGRPARSGPRQAAMSECCTALHAWLTRSHTLLHHAPPATGGQEDGGRLHRCAP